jgi:hypothetical protein
MEQLPPRSFGHAVPFVAGTGDPDRRLPRRHRGETVSTNLPVVSSVAPVTGPIRTTP